MEKSAYLVTDIETTGLSRHVNNITEIAAIKVVDNKIDATFSQLVNPKERIPVFITRLTGITNEMVKDAPLAKEVMPMYLEFAKDLPIVAHNAAFDFGFLSHNARVHCRAEMENKTICTRRLASRILDLPSRRLKDLCEHFKVENIQAHRAMGDALATLKVYNNFERILTEKGIHDIKAIIEFQKMQRGKLMATDRR